MTGHERFLSHRDSGRSRSQFWMLVAIFLGPLLIAFLLYYGAAEWRPAGRTNHGELIQPPIMIPELQLASADDSPLPATVLQGKWSVIYVGNGACNARCEEALTLMRQTRLALHDDLPRVQRLFLVTENCCNQEYLQSHHAGLVIVQLERADGGRFRTLLQDAIPEPLNEAGRIFIVDPLGNLMMSYPRDAEPKGLLADLKKLLKLSHIG